MSKTVLCFISILVAFNLLSQSNFTCGNSISPPSSISCFGVTTTSFYSYNEVPEDGSIWFSINEPDYYYLFRIYDPQSGNEISYQAYTSCGGSQVYFSGQGCGNNQAYKIKADVSGYTESFEIAVYFAMDCDQPACADIAASNYDPCAAYYYWYDYCEYPYPGCTDYNACNFIYEATIDDGSCEYESCYGCTDENACNFDNPLGLDDGSCLFEGEACDDGNSNTTNDVIQLDCSCMGELANPGCTDAQALNYDLMAENNDGSCIYPEEHAQMIDQGIDGCHYFTGSLEENLSGQLNEPHAWFQFSATSINLYLSISNECNDLGIILYDSELTVLMQHDLIATIAAEELMYTDLAIGETYFVEIASYGGELICGLEGCLSNVPPSAVLGDFDGNGIITIADLGPFLGQFGTSGEGLTGDFNQDGWVNVADLLIFLGFF